MRGLRLRVTEKGDDATQNVSRLCSVSSFSRWDAAPVCGERNHCREDIHRLVGEYFEAYNVRFTLSRPSPSEIFTTVIVAPPVAECTFGHRGIAFADCGDANPRSVAFVFDCGGDAASCAVLVAHETAHTFGAGAQLGLGRYHDASPRGAGASVSCRIVADRR